MLLISSPLLAVFPPPISPDLAEAARAYASAGIPVFPLCPGDKKPRIARGFHAATTDLATIGQWWQDWPEANIGVPTGKPSGLVVLDIDPRHGGDGALRHLQRLLDHHATDLGQPSCDLCHTCQSLSGSGGRHLFFGWFPSPHLHTTTRLTGEEGLDLRGTGGYIVVAPSRLLGGGRYRFLPSPSVQPFPQALIHLLNTRKQMRALPRFPADPSSSSSVCGSGARQRSDPACWLDFVLARTSIGNRHHQALFLACRLLQEAALSPAEAEPWMRAYASRVPQGLHAHEHYPEHDALACLAWASTHVI